MPIFCHLSDLDERISLINSWIQAICYKDLKQLKDAEYDSESAYNIMIHIASDSIKSLTQLASELGITLASVKKHDKAVGYFIAPIQKPYSIDKNIHVIPWNNIG